MTLFATGREPLFSQDALQTNGVNEENYLPFLPLNGGSWGSLLVANDFTSGPGKL